MLECVVNISEGRNRHILDRLAEAAGDDLLDIHSDADHNRSVFTLVGEDAPRRLTRSAVRFLSLASHDGVHPRLGVVDVVPFVPLEGSTMDDALHARHDFAVWISSELDIPVYLYGPERSLPTVRREAWVSLSPDMGPAHPHPTAGAVCVGARDVLVAYNVWLTGVDLPTTRRIAASVRSEHLRTLGLQVGDDTQISMNLVAPHTVGPAQAYDAVSEHVRIDHAELVGLIPGATLDAIPRDRWEELDLGIDRTIESRVAGR